MARIEISSEPGCDVDRAAARSAMLRALGFVGREASEVSILFAGDARIQELNRQFRDVDAPTDVMAFPSGEESGFLGDIIVSVETASRQAEELGHSLEQEVVVLLVHGLSLIHI